MTQTLTTKVLIIGAGTGGYVAGIRCGQLGLETVLVDAADGLIGGLFYGMTFGLGGVAAALIGELTDVVGIETVYRICSYLPLAGLLAWFLPDIRRDRST